MSRRIFIAWEIGGGRGHVVHLAAVAQALARRGFRNTAYLAHMEHAEELAPFCERVSQGPVPAYQPPSRALHNPRYGEWLASHHFDDSAVIRSQIERWRALIDAERPVLVLAEQSPNAILAARTLGLPVVQVGVPATAPPPEMPFYPPSLSEEEEPLYSEATLRDAINEAIGDYGLPPLSSLPEIYTCDDQIVASIGLLDSYARWRRQRRVPPVTGEWRDPGERRREELFVYLSTFDRSDPVILTAVASAKVPTRVVVAANLPIAVTAASWRGAIVEDRPLAPGEIARSARVLLHAGNHGMSCMGLRAGLPQVMLAGQIEHVFDGRAIAGAGAGLVVERNRWTVPNIRAAIEEAWENPAIAARATSLAADLAPEFEGDPGELTAERVSAVLRQPD
jgi:hypothetical protein